MQVAAKASGSFTTRSVYRWSLNAPDQVHLRLGMVMPLFHTGRLPRPSLTTLLRTLADTDPSSLPQTPMPPVVQLGEHLVLDGKTLRGSRSPLGSAVTVALYGTDGQVRAQASELVQGTEIDLVRHLLARENVGGTVLTLDALHTQKETCQLLVDADAEFVLTVKGNQPNLQTRWSKP